MTFTTKTRQDIITGAIIRCTDLTTGKADFQKYIDFTKEMHRMRNNLFDYTFCDYQKLTKEIQGITDEVFHGLEVKGFMDENPA